MVFRDAFDPQFRTEDLWFTFILGLALGIAAAGAWLALRDSRWRPWGALISASGAVAGLAVALAVLDRSPIEFVHFRVKPYAGELFEAAALGAIALAGATVTGAIILLGRRLSAPAGALAGTVVALAIVGAGLARFDAYTSRGFPRHPSNTDTAQQVPATRVIEGLSLPTGLAVAANGDLAVVEFEPPRFSLHVAGGGSYAERLASPLPVPEGGIALHVAFHPEYPAQPYVYVTAEGDRGESPTMALYRGRIGESAIEWTALVTGLPAADLEDNGDHFGGAVAVCTDSLFITTGDTEPGPRHHIYPGEPGTIRHHALQLSSPIGKVFRYRLDGADLRADGLADGAFPVYAFGFRNPFGMGCTPETGEPIVADNGPEGRDQVRPVPPGSNHEWPFSEDRDLYVQPYFDSKRARMAPTGVAARPTSDGFEVLFSAFNSQALYAFEVAGGEAGRLRLVRDVEGGAMNVVATKDGCVYFADVEAVWRLDDGRCR